MASFDTSGVGDSCNATAELVNEKGEAVFEIFTTVQLRIQFFLEYDVTSLCNRFPTFRGHCISSTRPGPII